MEIEGGGIVASPNNYIVIKHLYLSVQQSKAAPSYGSALHHKAHLLCSSLLGLFNCPNTAKTVDIMECLEMDLGGSVVKKLFFWVKFVSSRI